MALLNEILGGLSVDEGDFSQEWTEVFGETEEGTSAASTRPTEAQDKENFFLPSQLLDQSLNNLQSSISGQPVCVCVATVLLYKSEPENWQVGPRKLFSNQKNRPFGFCAIRSILSP